MNPIRPIFKRDFMNYGAMLLQNLRDLVMKVKKLRKWYVLNKLTRAFTEACLVMRLKTVKSFSLIRAIVKAIKELREILSEESKLLKMGVEEAWKISALASSWGHPSSKNWKNSKYFILYHALTLKWISRLFTGVMLR